VRTDGARRGAEIRWPAMAVERGTDDILGRLMQAAQGGDRRAYSTLLTQIAPVIRRLVRRRQPFLTAADVEDLVQDVLLSVHSVRATYDIARPFLPWLIAITRNRVADAARRYARTGAHEVAVDEYPETFEAAETNTETETYGDPEALRQAVQQLPEGQRVAVELTKLNELSLKEAALRSGMSVAALKVATHRATRALRVMLKGRG
jgi:RNA polymerase sigma-70 factor (ECF subfamily)